MKIKVLATALAPDCYEFVGDVVEAFESGHKEVYDLRNFPEGGIFLEAEKLPSGAQSIRGVKRVGEELIVTLTQRVIAGQYPGRKAHWRESPIIDAEDYDPEICYVIPTGMAGVDDYEIVQGVDVAGNTGWTVRKKEMADG
ncbi:hypothetical protein LCL99_02780 [Halomonas denitrificans]|uniref:hypothetical protein n=1 Tax=Halomonas denitrificans TaxID=370769 RepID=UPI001CD694BE|nr:hypothetical protein [Halomonas denitrificans]MCA0973388.1 hypothetical protein [Halomonas denitrificans]